MLKIRTLLLLDVLHFLLLLCGIQVAMFVGREIRGMGVNNFSVFCVIVLIIYGFYEGGYFIKTRIL